MVDSQGKLININFYGLLEELSEALDKNVDLLEISEIKRIALYIKIFKKRGLYYMKSKDRIIVQKIISYINDKELIIFHGKVLNE